MQTLKCVTSPFRAVERWFLRPVDGRTYAAVRIAFGLFAFGVWLESWPLRTVFYADVGLFGPSVPGGPLGVNVFALSNSAAVVDAVFLLGLLAIACTVLGVFTRVALLIVYLWAVSCSTQSPITLAGYDTVLRATAFSLLVSPVSAHWSVRPQWFAGTFTDLPRYGARVLQWQLMLIYWCTVWLKAPDQYWRRGEVVSHMLMSNFARFPTPLGAHIGILDPLLTWGTLLIEALVPVLMWGRATRGLGLLLGLVLHGGIALGAKLGLFSLAMVPLYLAFLERRDWVRLSTWVRSRWPWAPRPREADHS